MNFEERAERIISGDKKPNLVDLLVVLPRFLWIILKSPYVIIRNYLMRVRIRSLEAKKEKLLIEAKIYKNKHTQTWN